MLTVEQRLGDHIERILPVGEKPTALREAQEAISIIEGGDKEHVDYDVALKRIKDMDLEEFITFSCGEDNPRFEGLAAVADTPEEEGQS